MTDEKNKEPKVESKNEDLSGLTLDEKFEKVIEKVSSKEGQTNASFLEDMLLNLSKVLPKKDEAHKFKKENMSEMLNNIVLADMLRKTESDILEQYIKKEYDAKIKALEELREQKKERALTEKESNDYRKVYDELKNPFSEEGDILTHQEYHQISAASPYLMDQMRVDHPEVMNPLVEKLETQNREKYNDLAKKAGVDQAVDNQSPQDPLLKKQAISLTFNDVFPNKLSMALTASKLTLGLPAFATGVAIKTGLALFMKTEAGQKIGEEVSEKFNKVFPSKKNKSFLKSKFGIALATVGVVGLSIAGLDEFLPDEAKEVVYNGLEETMSGAKNYFVENAPESLQTTIANVSETVSEKVGLGLESAKTLYEEKMPESFKTAATEFSNKLNDTLDSAKESMGVGNQEALADSGQIPEAVEVPEFEKVTVPEGGNLETVAKNALGPDASPQEIRSFTLKIAEANGITDANSIQPGEFKVPTNHDTSGVLPPSLDVKTLDDALNLPYGVDATNKDVIDSMMKVIETDHPDLSAQEKLTLRVGLNGHFEGSLNAMVDPSNLPKSDDIERLVQAHATHSYPSLCETATTNSNSDMCMSGAREEAVKSIASESTPDAQQEKSTSPHYDSRGGRYGNNR